MSLLHHPQFSSWIRGHLLCRVEGVPGRFALTFDDGPHPRWTPGILDLLARHHAHASFFMLAGAMRRQAAVVRRMIDEGHEPALHGDRHWPLPLTPPWVIRDELRRGASALRDTAAATARFYRPPFGFMMPAQASFVRRLGYESVLGDVYPEDPHRPGTDRIVARVLPRLQSGSILILHDGSPLGDADRSQTLDALARILPEASRRGLRAVTVRELIEAGSRTVSAAFSR